MVLYIRTDANEEIGTGHVMRCLSIAEEYREQKGEAVFITADSRSGEMIAPHGFRVICLESVWDDPESELDSLLRVIREEPIRLLLADSYFVTEQYLRTLKAHTKVAYIDDLDRFIYPVDLLINYNIFADELDYPGRYREAGSDTRFALGCRYAPLRKEFRHTGRAVTERARKILVTSGGTDVYDGTGHLLSEMYERPWFRQMEFEAVIGRYNANKAGLEGRWGKYGNVHFRYNAENMAELMRECDLAVTAGGSTVYEIMACGTPAIVYTLADNQLGIARAVSDMGIMPWAGDVREDIGSCCRAAADAAERYIRDFELREQISRRMRKIVDGEGSGRVVSALRRLTDGLAGNDLK